MRVLFSTTAGAGHFAPVIPFARACLDAGVDVRVAAPASFASTVTGAGFAHAAFDDGDPAQIGAVFAQVGLGTVREANVRVLRDIFGRIDAAAALPGLRAIVDEWRPDVIVSETAEFGSALVAEERGIPQLQVNIGLDAFTDLILDLVDESLRALGSRSGSERLRAVPRLSLLPNAFDEGGASVHRFRDAVVPDVGQGIAGTWWPDRYADDPLVYVSFGSVAGHMGFYPDFYRRVLGALADVPARVLMTLGAGLDPTALGEVAANVHVESWWPQEDVMREASAVVSHGGFGTLMATLAHGLPQVVVPLFSADQYANAERVATSGVGVSLSPGDPLVLRSADLVPSGPDLTGLSAAVVRTLHDRAVQDAAQTVAAEIARLPETAEFLRLLP